MNIQELNHRNHNKAPPDTNIQGKAWYKSPQHPAMGHNQMSLLGS